MTKCILEAVIVFGSLWFLIGGGYAHLLYTLAGWME